MYNFFMSKLSKLEERANIVKYIYQYEVFKKDLLAVEAFESGDYSQKEIDTIEKIAKAYPKLKALISKYFMSNWTWYRIDPLERAILLLGSYEMIGTDKALVINEMVILAKGYIPGESYKFINSVLDKVGGFYDSIKKTK